IDRKQYVPITDKEYTLLRGRSIAFPKDFMTTLVNQQTGESIRIFHGTPLPVNLKGLVEIGSHTWKPEGDVFYRPTSLPDRKNIVDMAKSYQHAPYLWGGKSCFGCDCSGFVQTVYNMNGVSIKRDASQQAREGETVNLIDEASPGDIVFFDNHEGNIIHVGILIEENQIIHASGCVRIDKIDHFGIFNPQQQTYTHKLRIIKRYL
ncbi:MAG: C40 family peptidase, partial [Oscillospiraceae bacterium]|nr:C40 family peptidase [Oscillospiraceae bacterium]